MFQRNQLVQAVIWPNGKTANIALLDTDGVVQGQFKLTEPMLGDTLVKMVPDGFSVEPEQCTVYSLAGPLVVRTVGEFDTAVVTERPQLDFEQRLANMEVRQRYADRRNEKLREQNEALQARLEAQDALLDTDPGDEPDDPQAKPQDPPQPASDVTDKDPKGKDQSNDA